MLAGVTVSAALFAAAAASPIYELKAQLQGMSAQEIIDRMYMKEVKCKKNENWCERISLFYQPHIM